MHENKYPLQNKMCIKVMENTRNGNSSSSTFHEKHFKIMFNSFITYIFSFLVVFI